MRDFERGFVIWAIVYTGIYVPIFIGIVVSMAMRAPHQPPAWVFYIGLPLHFLGMVQNFAALVLTIRDLYRRPFPHPNDKLTWSLVILLTGGIGWLVYVFRHAIRPRPPGENGLTQPASTTGN